MPETTTGLGEWNDRMYLAHPTPYSNKTAGVIERRRLKIIRDLAGIGKGERVIELGCEQGVLLGSLPTCRELVGVDISAVALKDAKRRLGERAQLIKADIEKGLSLGRRKFEVVICSQVLEHVKKPEKVMENIYRLAKKNARVVVSVPNEKFMLRWKKILNRLGVLDFLFPGIEKGISDWHLQVFTDRKLRRLVGKNFKIIKHRRAFNVYLIYLLEKN